jgi:hypothetical protein
VTTTPADARRAGTEVACHLITVLADAGMTADRIDQAAEDVLGGRFDQPTPVSDQFYAESDRTAATCVADLRELEAG